MEPSTRRRGVDDRERAPMAEPWMAVDDQRRPGVPPDPAKRLAADPPVRTRAAGPAPRPARRRSRAAASKILFINQYYWPDHASTAQHLADLAESMAERGYECHVALRPGPLPARRARSRRPIEVHEGVRIHRVRATSLGRRGTLARMTDYLSFYAGAVLKAIALPRFDAVVTLTTPPIIGLVGTCSWMAQGLAARLLEHGPAPRREPRAAAGCRRGIPVVRSLALAQRLRLPEGRSRGRARARTWPTGSR